jgi:hypothetical protein
MALAEVKVCANWIKQFRCIQDGAASPLVGSAKPEEMENQQLRVGQMRVSKVGQIFEDAQLTRAGADGDVDREVALTAKRSKKLSSSKPR